MYTCANIFIILDDLTLIFFIVKSKFLHTVFIVCQIVHVVNSDFRPHFKMNNSTTVVVRFIAPK